MLDDLAFDQRVDDVAQACLPLELVLAGLEIIARIHRHDAADEDPPRLVDHALAREDLGDVSAAHAARNIDDLVLRERAGLLEALLAEHGGAASREAEHEDDGKQSVAGDNDWIASTARAARAWHLLGLKRSARTARADSFHLHERYTSSIELSPGDGRVRIPCDRHRPS